MLNGRVFVLIVFVSVVTLNSVDAGTECSVTDGFDINKLNGTWHYIAGINPKNSRIKCGYLVLNRVSNYNLLGYKVDFLNGKLRNLTATAYVRDKIMNLRTFENDQSVQVSYTWMRTCNGESEFSLELPRERFYWIFSKDTTVTPIFLEYFRMVGQELGLKFRLAKNRFCPKL